ncbi:PP2C family serine/threonine-protein phosphatase [Synechocystis sp. PCC 7339]|uniref:PP2C family serine/threonine-protein phosphatase n=1 Tax=Synechocystis sp. PCC 7338 TaxID=2732530 RepID=UPI00210834DD|nr:PP2C family serine/threonine-protein phosphatase [Synechocystis sp. PCC 7339]
MTKVQQELQHVTQVSKVEFPDLATTLLVFIATSKWLVAMQIGDGFILAKPVGEKYQLLFQPDKGEYINETTFVTSANASAEMQIRVLAEPLEFICAATDGVEKVAINYADWQPFPPFFQPLEQYLQTTEQPLEEDLKEFLQRKDLNARTTDDKTLLLALWTNNQ